MDSWSEKERNAQPTHWMGSADFVREALVKLVLTVRLSLTVSKYPWQIARKIRFGARRVSCVFAAQLFIPQYVHQYGAHDDTTLV